MADDPTVQPTEGQGATDDTFGYDLSGVPEDHREIVAEHLTEARKMWDGEATKKFQEAADYRKQWEPYESLGVNQIPPEDLSQLVQFAELASDEGRFDEWLRNVASERGILPQDVAEEIAGADPTQIQQLVEQQTAPLREFMESQQTQQAEQQAASSITSTLDEFAEKHGDFDREMVCALALPLAETEGLDSAMSKAFEQYQSFKSQTEKAILSSKLNQPDTPERGGSPVMGGEKVTSFADAREMALERMRQATSA